RSVSTSHLAVCCRRGPLVRLVELRRHIAAGQPYERLVLGLEARTRLRIGQGCFERGVKLVYIRVVASFLERTRECIDVGATRLINVGRKLRIDVEVVRVLVRRLAT